MASSGNPDLTRISELAAKAFDGSALTSAEALLLYRGLDQPSLGLVANDIRLRINPPQADGSVKATYIVDRNLNPTNVCVTDCGFCAFYRSPGDADAYVLPREVIYQKVDELIAQGGMQLLLQGGHHPKLKTDWYAELFQDLKQTTRIFLCTKDTSWRLGTYTTTHYSFTVSDRRVDLQIGVEYIIRIQYISSSCCHFNCLNHPDVTS